MEATLVDEKKLEELVDKAVQRHLELTVQDMEAFRHSPAGILISVEGRLGSLENRIERDVETRADLANLCREIQKEIREARLFLNAGNSNHPH